MVVAVVLVQGVLRWLSEGVVVLLSGTASVRGQGFELGEVSAAEDPTAPPTAISSPYIGL